jgi:hypothetical protein
MLPDSNALASTLSQDSQLQQDRLASSSKAATLQRLRDETFYFEVVIFLVEDVLFKVPRLYFETNSVVFRDLFANLPSTQDGTGDDNPIKLEAIRSIDFQRFSTVAFPELSWHARSPIVMSPLSLNEWISVLKLSTEWKFAELRRKALEVLSWIRIDPVERVILARKYKVEKWVVDAYTQLVVQDNRLSLKEAEILGYDTAFQLYEMREESFRQSLSRYGSRPMVDELKEEMLDMARRELGPDSIT